MADHGNGQTAPDPQASIDILRSLILEQQAALERLEASNQALASALERVLLERFSASDDGSFSQIPADEYVPADGSTRMLSKREREVLALMVEGKSSKQIAALLGISFKTAVTHRASIMSKMDLHETASVVREAIRRGLV